MKDKTRTFDAVKIMRDARDALGKETAGMRYKEQRRYIENRLGRSSRKDRNSG